MGFKKFISSIYVKNVLIALGIVIVLLFLLMQWLDVYTKHGQQVTVPAIKGLQVEAAESLLQQQGLTYLVVDSIYLKNHKPGSIYETTPPAGTHVKPGKTIYLTINSRIADMITVPSVYDLSQRQAIALLNSQGFASIQIKSVPGAYKDLVVGLENLSGNSIRPGTKANANSTLVLLVGSGNNNVPDSIEDDELLLDDETLDETFN